MSIRNTNLGGGSNWSDGDILYSADLNDTFDAVPRIVGTDLVGGTISSSTSSIALTKLAEVAVPANVVTNYIVLKSLYKLQSHLTNDGAYGSTVGSLHVYIGESGSEADKESMNNAVDTVGARVRAIDNGTFTYYYEPSSAEKANGFNVQIFGRVTVGGVVQFEGIAQVIQLLVEGQ